MPRAGNPARRNAGTIQAHARDRLVFRGWPQRCTVPEPIPPAPVQRLHPNHAIPAKYASKALLRRPTHPDRLVPLRKGWRTLLQPRDYRHHWPLGFLRIHHRQSLQFSLITEPVTKVMATEGHVLYPWRSGICRRRTASRLDIHWLNACFPRPPVVAVLPAATGQLDTFPQPGYFPDSSCREIRSYAKQPGYNKWYFTR